MGTESERNELRRLNLELAAMNRELAKRTAQLEAVNTEKTQFLGMAAHDLRNPLGAIRSFAEFVLDDAGPQLAAAHVDLLRTICELSDSMLQLVGDLLDVTAIEEGRVRLTKRPMRLDHFLERNVRRNRMLAGRKGIRLAFENSGLTTLVPIDAAKIAQVMDNLISNAVKYSHPETEVEIRLSQSLDCAVVEVADQGQGIPAEELPQLFRPFMKTSVKSTANEPSTGLGLAIAKRIIEAHGGRVWVTSEPGYGSTFAFCIPLVHATREHAHEVHDLVAIGAEPEPSRR